MPAASDTKKYASQVTRILRKHYSEATCSLRFDTPLELLVATILSAQCTDERVNLVTKELFQKYRNASDYAKAPLKELEKNIQSTGFFHNKAKNLQGCCRKLLEDHEGEVPRVLEELVELPGVGRKTANVVLGTAFGIPTGIAVDTHVGRLSQRMGLSCEKTPEKIEKDLMASFPQKEWIALSHRLIQHGRRVCTARKPLCTECPLKEICPRIGVAEK